MAASGWSTGIGPEAGAARARRAAYGGVGAWFLLAAVGGALGWFEAKGPPAAIGAYTFAPIAAWVAAYRGSARLREGLRGIPLWILTLSHTWRFVGVGFVLASLAGALPRGFAWPAGFGDALAAAAAIPLAARLVAGRRSAALARAHVAWNVFGLADLVIALGLGVLYSPSSFGLLRGAVSTEVMTRFPIHLIPIFFVPLFVLLHLLGLVRRAEVAATDPSGRSRTADPLRDPSGLSHYA